MFVTEVYFASVLPMSRRSQWPRGLRRRSAVARLLTLWVWIPSGEWMSVWCECCMLSGRGLCDELITRPDESYRLWWVVVCDLETSWMRRPWPSGGCRPPKKQTCNDLRVIVIISQFLRPLGLHINFLKPCRDGKSGKSVFLVMTSDETYREVQNFVNA